MALDKKRITALLSELEVLQGIVQTYGEIASIRMKTTRESVISTREFLSALQDIFEDVRASYAKEIGHFLQNPRRKTKKGLTLLSHNGKSVAVLLSSNSGLYGDIVHRTFRVFLKEAQQQNSEVTIIGKQGASLYEHFMPNKPYTFFALPDYGFSREQMAQIMEHIVQYSQVYLYFGQFENVLRQKPVKFELAAELDLSHPERFHSKREYLFEPSLEKILQFFEKEIFASLFTQTVRESQLSKFASRILAMDQAMDRIKEQRSKYILAKHSAAHRLHDRKQLNSLSGILMNVGH